MPVFTNAASNSKTAKKLEELSIEAVILHLAPADLAYPGKSVCPWASLGCIAACLNSSGHGQFKGELNLETVADHHVHQARIRRTREFFDDRGKFVATLDREISNLERRAEKRGNYTPAARPNGTSDLPWERIAPELFENHSAVRLYDYTKSKKRALEFAAGKLPANYHLTFSRSENTTDSEITEIVYAGCNVAVVFGGDKLPEEYLGFPVIDGLEHDFRFLDPKYHIVGLLEKGRAKVDDSGFVVRGDF